MAEDVVGRPRSSGFDWLYPELLSQDELIQALKQHSIQVGDTKSLSKEELVKLYNNHVVPLPQRKYRLNRRGKQMTKKQILTSKKRRLIITPEISSISEPPEKKTRPTSGVVNSISTSSPTGDRLKPPPSCVDFTKKKIKLGSSSSSSSPPVISSSVKELSLTKITDNPVKSEVISNKSVKVTNTSRDSTCSSETKFSAKKTIKMINNHLSSDKPSVSLSRSSKANIVKLKSQSSESKAEPTQMEVDTEQADTKMDTTTQDIQQQVKKKPKLKRISWP